MKSLSKKEKNEVAEKHPVFDWIDAMVSAAVFCMVIFTFFIKSFRVVGPSMLPNYVEGERVIVASVFAVIKPGDVVVTDAHNGTGDPLIKRVLALEGDEIYIEEDGTIYRNGEVYQDIVDTTRATRNGDTVYPLVVPEGCVFLLGDNRMVSFDSRYVQVGCVPVECIVGKVLN